MGYLSPNSMCCSSTISLCFRQHNLNVSRKQRKHKLNYQICSLSILLELISNRSLKTFEPRHEKTNVFDMQKQRRRSASR